MRRREFITVISGALAWSPDVVAQQPTKMPRIGILMPHAEDDPEGQARVAALRQELERRGWQEGRTIHVDYRWGASDQKARAVAADLVSLAPHLIVVNGTPGLAALRAETRTIPVVFAQVSDPVGAGFVASAAQPGGNVTGFTDYEYAFSVKWLELLKEVAPRVARAGVIYDPANQIASKFLQHIEAGGPSRGIEVTPIPVRDPADIERGITAYASSTNDGLIVLAGSTTLRNREGISSLALRHHLPAVYPYRAFAVSGGLISYGIDVLAMYRGAASYVDRVLKGEKVGDLPVQFGTKFELVINLKTAKALAVEIPPTLLARADEVIE